MTKTNRHPFWKSFITNVCLPLLPLAGTLALIGCSSVKMRIDAAPVHGESFSFLKASPQPYPAYAEDRSQVHQIFQDAITKTLSAKGLRHVPEGGDINVAYLIIVGNNVETTSLNRYFGYSSDATELVDKIHNEQAVKGENRNYFEAGTLVVDLVDAKTSKVLQRRSIQAQVLRNLPIETRIERAQKFVDQALADVQISK
jgi:hypothetical protein